MNIKNVVEENIYYENCVIYTILYKSGGGTFQTGLNTGRNLRLIIVR